MLNAALAKEEYGIVCTGSNSLIYHGIRDPIATMKRVADDCRESGIYTDANIIIGLPGETKQDIEDIRSFLKTANVSWFRKYHLLR